MTISLKTPRRYREPVLPELDARGIPPHADAVVWVAGRGHETDDEALHIDFPMALAYDQALAMHRAATAAEVWKLMRRMPGDRLVSLPVKGEPLELVARSLSAWLDDTAQTVVHAARIGLGRDTPTERSVIEDRFLENTATDRDGRPRIPLHERTFAIMDDTGFHSRPDALLTPLAPDETPQTGQAEYAAGIGPAEERPSHPRITMVMAVDPHPRIALLRTAWIIRHTHGVPFLRSLGRSRLAMRAGLVLARDADAYRALVNATATAPRDLAGIGGVPDIDLLPSMKAIDKTLVDPEGWTALKAARRTEDDRELRDLCGELSLNRNGDNVELW